MPFSITSNLPIATLAMLVIGLGMGYLVLRIAFFYRVGIHEDKAPDRSLLSSSLALALSRRKIDSSARRKHVVCLAFCLLFLWILIQYGATPRTIAISIACTLLALAALIDNDTGFLPDTLTIPLIGLGLLLSWAQWIPISLYSATIGACLTYAAMWLLNVFYRELRGLDGMGGGDAKLASGIGAWLGLPDVLWVLSLACLLGIIVTAVSSGRYNGKQSLRFGPYLAASAIVWMVGG